MTPNLSKLSLQLYHMEKYKDTGGVIQGVAVMVGAIWKVLIEKLWCGDVELWEQAWCVVDIQG